MNNDDERDEQEEAYNEHLLHDPDESPTAMKLWSATVAQQHTATVNVWMPDDATTEDVEAEALRYADALQANGRLYFDGVWADLAIYDVEHDEIVEAEMGSPDEMAYNLAPEYRKAANG